MTKNNERKLNSLQWQYMRRILGIRWQQRMTKKRVVEVAEINDRPYALTGALDET